MTPEDSQLADVLQSQLGQLKAEGGRVRIGLPRLRTLQAEAEAHRASRPGAAARLRHALDVLADRGVVETPVSPGLWDHAVRPPLPHWVRIVADSAHHLEAPRELRDVDWAPQIAGWIDTWAEYTRPAASMRQALVDINRWLLKHLLVPRPANIGREERAFEIFKDEKRLTHLERTSIFENGRLTAHDLSYERPVAPLRAARLAEQGSLLVVENQASFDSAWRALCGDPGCFCAIVFGNGWEVAAPEALRMLPAHLGLAQPPEEIWYVGDIDAEGLDIPSTLAVACPGCDLPRPEPLAAAYAAMLARPDAARPTTGKVPSPDITSRITRWLPDELQQPAAELIAVGLRIPQEILDRSWWRHRNWMPRK